VSARPLYVVPNPVVAGLEPYSPGRPPAAIDVFLDANEGPMAPAGLGAVLAGAATLHRYPSAAALEARIAVRLGVDPAAVLVTAGADDALERAIRAVCTVGCEAILTTPSFAMLPRYARLAGAEVLELPWWRGEWPVDEALAAATERTALVAVVSPNNPTGSVISRAAFERLADALPRSLVLLDHAYVEFAAEDLTAAALERANVLVFRTFSKARGAAGLRVGWVAGDPRVVRWLRSVGQPYSVSAASLAAADWLLDHAPELRPGHLDAVREQRARLAELLTELGGEPLPSEGNFVLARVSDAIGVRDALAALGIAVRAFAGSAELAEWLRITVPGDEAIFRRLERALRAALAPEALLFDLDGVLADVSRSYRAAIVATAAAFGVAVSRDDIVAVKAAGNANNDWVVTRRLLAARGVEASLDEVATRFEALYQGGDGRPGLRETERATVPRALLEGLAARRPLAVVTGRPQADAERFLAEQGIRDLFTVLVTMEDAAPKPDPAPVRVALERLGTASAWMLGDTPDDLVAARAAGVVPIGVVAPGDDPERARTVLLAAGAARVLDRVEELLEVLP